MNNSIRISTWIHEIEYSDLYQHLAPLNGTQRARRVRQLMRMGLATLLNEASPPARASRAGDISAAIGGSPGSLPKTAAATTAQTPNSIDVIDAFGLDAQKFKFDKEGK